MDLKEKKDAIAILFKKNTGKKDQLDVFTVPTLLEIVKVIDKIKDPNSLDETGIHLLVYAVQSGRKDVIEYLIQSKNVDVNLVSFWGYTALNTACQSDRDFDNAEIVRVLLANGANVQPISESKMKEFNIATNYWLKKAKKIPKIDMEESIRLKALQLPNLHKLDFAIVGQIPAITLLKRALEGFKGMRVNKTKPLILLLCGPPGHGKTVLAEELKNVMNCKYLYVNCELAKTAAHLFGYPAPYVSSRKKKLFFFYTKLF